MQNRISFFKHQKEYIELKHLRDSVQRKLDAKAESRRRVARWPQWYIFRIMIWKNMTIRQRCRKHFFLLLFQILVWFAIATFNLRMSTNETAYRQGTSLACTELVPPHLLSNIHLPIGVSYNDSEAYTRHKDLDDPQRPTAHRTIRRLMEYVRDYYAMTYGGVHPPIHFFPRQSDLIRDVTLGSLVVYGIHFDSVLMSSRRVNVSYRLIFREQNVPIHNTNVDALECRRQLGGDRMSLKCATALYTTNGFIFVQSAINNAVLLLAQELQQIETRGRFSFSENPFRSTCSQNIACAESSGSQAPSSSYPKTSFKQRPLEHTKFTEQSFSTSFSHQQHSLAHDQKEKSSPLHTGSPFRLEFPGISLVAEKSPERYAVPNQAKQQALHAPFYFLMALVPLFSFVLMDLIPERELLVKDIMHTYGVSKPILWVSWLITYAIQILPVTLLMVFLCFLGNVFGPKTSVIVVAILFYTYLLSLVTFTFMISIFFRKSQIASMAGLVFNLFLYIVGRIIHQKGIIHYGLRRGVSNCALRVMRRTTRQCRALPLCKYGELYQVERRFYFFFLVQLMLFSTITFSVSVIDIMSKLPDGGVEFVDLFKRTDDGSSIGVLVLFLILDLVLYFALTVILDKYSQSMLRRLRVLKLGICIAWRGVWSFLWRRGSMGNSLRTNEVEPLVDKKEVPSSTNLCSTQTNMEENYMEAVPPKIEERGVAVRIQQLTKCYPVDCFPSSLFFGSQEQKRVVDSLSLDLYPGEIFALLGHNGAGKTTTLATLMGITEIDSGDITIYGYSMRHQQDQARKLISLCPQHNIFFDDFSCLEHIIFFSSLRGIDVQEGLDTLTKGVAYFNELMDAHKMVLRERSSLAEILVMTHGKPSKAYRKKILRIERYLARFHLSLFLDDGEGNRFALSHRNSPVFTWNHVLLLIERLGLATCMFYTPRSLSGSMKRKLWLAIGLLGNPRVIVLDEPTLGVDPSGRHDIWGILEHEKKEGRCILITTHDMEEADILADRKAVMVGGRMCCMGSSLFLKSRFRVGYRLEIVKEYDGLARSLRDSAHEILMFIRSFVNDAHYASQETETINKWKESYCNDWKPRLCWILFFFLPESQVHQFSSLFHALESNKTQLGIREYGVSFTALEDIFFKLLDAQDHDFNEIRLPKSLQLEKSASTTLFACSNPPSNHIITSQEPLVYGSTLQSCEEAICKKGSLHDKSLSPTPTLKDFSPLKFGYRGDYVSQKFPTVAPTNALNSFGAITRLRWLQISHNKTLFCIHIVIPVMILLVALFFLDAAPGSFSTLSQASSYPAVPLTHYTALFDTMLPFYIDPRLSKVAIAQSHALLDAFPDPIRSSLNQVDRVPRIVESHNEEAQHNRLRGWTESYASSVKEPRTAETVRRKSHMDPGVEPTFCSARSLRNFLFVKHNTSHLLPFDAYVAGFGFERRAPPSGVLSTNNSFGSDSELQLRLLYNPTQLHILPVLVSLVSNALLRRSMTETTHPLPGYKLHEEENREEFNNNTYYKTRKERQAEIYNIHTETLPVLLEALPPQTPLTYRMYALLSLSLSILPWRFGAQVMLEKMLDVKHTLIVMGLPYKDYWVGTFSVDYLGMLLGNLMMWVVIAYFIPLFWSAAAIPVVITMVLCSASTLLYAFALTELFTEIKSYNMALPLSCMLMSLGPLYFMSTLRASAVWGSRWYLWTFVIHVVSSFTLPPYNPIGVLMGSIVLLTTRSDEGRLPPIREYFLPKHLPIWNILGSATQAIFLHYFIVWVDRSRYMHRAPSTDAQELLDTYYFKKDHATHFYVNAVQNACSTLAPEETQTHKDEDVYAEEMECRKIHNILVDQETSFQTATSMEEKKRLSHYYQQLARENPEIPNVLPLVLLHNVHYIFPPSRSRESPVVPLQGLSVKVQRGEIFGLLGPNGAGKSTLLGLLTCHHTTPAPTRGKANIGGYNVCQNPTASFSHLGFCPQSDALWDNLTVRDNLSIIAQIKGVPQSHIEQVVNDYLDKLALRQYENTPFSVCSRGNKRRVSVAAALIGDPDVVFFDEPYSGIDPVGRSQVADLIRHNALSRCVILSTHSMQEAEALCTKIGILVNGELNCLNTPLILRNRYGSGIRLEVHFQQQTFEGTTQHAYSSWYTFLQKNIAVHVRMINHVANRITYSIPLRYDSLGTLFDLLQQNKNNFGIKEYSISQPTLEQIFISFSKRQKSPIATSQQFF